MMQWEGKFTAAKQAAALLRWKQVTAAPAVLLTLLLVGTHSCDLAYTLSQEALKSPY